MNGAVRYHSRGLLNAAKDTPPALVSPVTTARKKNADAVESLIGRELSAVPDR
jgi:hypothetical protein